MTRKAGRKNEVDAASRMLALFEYLKQQGFFDEMSPADYHQKTLSIDEIQRHFGWSPNEIIRLAEDLACCGQCDYLAIPLYVDTDNDCIVSAGSFSTLKRPIRLSSAECTALVAALELAGIGSDDPLRGELLANVADADEGRAPWDRQLLVSPEGSGRVEDLLLLLSSAIIKHRLVRIVYTKQSSTQSTERIIEPIVFTLENGKWYLHAYCRLRGALRVFSLFGIRKAELLDEEFTPRDSEVTRFSSLLKDGFPLARLRADADVMIEPRDWPGLVIESEEEDGARIMTIPYSHSLWLPIRILARSGKIRALEPASLVDKISELAHEKTKDALDVQGRWDELASRADAEYWQQHLHTEAGAGCAKEELVETLSHIAW